MIRSLQTLRISSDALNGFAEVAHDMGFDSHQCLARFGLDPEAALSGKGKLDFQSLADLLEYVAKAHDCRDFGFRLAKAQQPLRYGVISQLPAISPTIGEALRTFIRYQRLYSQSSHWALIVEGDIACLRRRDIAVAARARPQLVLFSLTLAAKALKAIAGADWNPIGIYFDNDAYGDLAAMRRSFDTPLFPNSAYNEIAFAAESLDWPIPGSNPALLSVLMSHLDDLLEPLSVASTPAERAYERIRANLGSEHCTLEWTAHELGFHPRELQRALAIEKANFRALLNEARMELARHLLEHTAMTVAEIADMLGYARLSGFSKACRILLGSSPTALRQHQKEFGTSSAGAIQGGILMQVKQRT